MDEINRIIYRINNCISTEEEKLKLLEQLIVFAEYEVNILKGVFHDIEL